MYDEILEGAKRDSVMTPEFMKLIHGFRLEQHRAHGGLQEVMFSFILSLSMITKILHVA